MNLSLSCQSTLASASVVAVPLDPLDRAARVKERRKESDWLCFLFVSELVYRSISFCKIRSSRFVAVLLRQIRVF